MLSERRERLVARHTDKKWNKKRESEKKKKEIYRSSKYIHVFWVYPTAYNDFIRFFFFSLLRFVQSSCIRDIEYHSRYLLG
jgi:hypothetical protein